MNVDQVRQMAARVDAEAERMQSLLDSIESASEARAVLEQKKEQTLAAAAAARDQGAARLRRLDGALAEASRLPAQARREQASTRQIRPPLALARQQPQSVAPEQAALPPSECYLSRDGQVFGPYSWPQVQQYAASGQIAPTDMLWLSERQEWVQAAGAPGLFDQPGQTR